MWTGGVRVVLTDEEGRILLVRQHHPERDIWLVPGGAVEDGETSREACVREVREETGLEIEVGPLLWHVEQVKEGGEQRFVNYFLARITGGEPALGTDPELGEKQVLRELRFMSVDEMKKLPDLYPEFLAYEIEEAIRAREDSCDPYRIREK